MLEQEGYTVIMTRESDEPIAAANEPDAKKRKAADMKKREEIIRTANADAFVSIHQNFFEKGSGAAGPQVFCRDREAAGYELAKYVQAALNEQLSIQNPRDVNTCLLYTSRLPGAEKETAVLAVASLEIERTDAVSAEEVIDVPIEGLTISGGSLKGIDETWLKSEYPNVETPNLRVKIPSGVTEIASNALRGTSAYHIVSVDFSEAASLKRCV